MTKRYLLFAAFLLTGLFANAQSGSSVSLTIGPEYSIPFNTNTYNYGHIRDVYSNGIGGNIKLGVPIDSSFSFILSSGFVSYAGNAFFYPPTPDISGETVRLTMHYTFIPITAGLRYHLSKQWYIGAEAGVAVKVSTYTSTNFIYGIGDGIVLPVGKHGGLDFSVKYMRGYEILYYQSPMSQLSIGVAYRFDL